MATIDLGRLGFVNKGTYNNSTTYEKNDLVQFTDGGILSTYLYIDSTAQSGQAPSSSGTVGSRWVYFAKGVADAVASAGNNKVLVTDGSGSLSPLSIGSAGQSLKVNSGANGFEFGTISSDYVKISESTTSGTPGSIQFKTTAQSGELDFSTYSRYEIYLDNVTHTASSNDYANLHCRYLNSSGSTLSDASYFFINNAGGISGSSDNGGRSQNEIRLTRDYIGKQSGRSQHFHITLYDMTNTSYQKNILCTAIGNNHDGSGGTPRQDVTGAFYASTAAMSGIVLYLSDGNFVNGIKIRTYGVK